MGEDSSVIRAEIEQTRERVGDEVDALSYKTDVSARVGDYVDDKKQAVKSKFVGAKDTVTRPLPDRRTIQHMRGTAESNPLGLALGGLAVGFVVGTLLPGTRMENERMGEVSDRLMDAARETAQDAVERGKQVAQEAVEHGREAAQEAVGATVDATKESVREQGHELTSTLQDRAQGTVSQP